MQPRSVTHTSRVCVSPISSPTSAREAHQAPNKARVPFILYPPLPQPLAPSPLTSRVCVSDLLPNIGARGPSSAKQGKGAVHVTSARCEPVEPLLLLPWRAAGRRSRWCPVVPRRHRATLKPLPPRLHPSRPEQLVDGRRVEEQVKSTTLARVHRVGQSIGLAAW